MKKLLIAAMAATAINATAADFDTFPVSGMWTIKQTATDLHSCADVYTGDESTDIWLITIEKGQLKVESQTKKSNKNLYGYWANDNLIVFKTAGDGWTRNWESDDWLKVWGNENHLRGTKVLTKPKGNDSHYNAPCFAQYEIEMTKN